jgi:hypothetical protein
MAISNAGLRQSETWREILSQGQVWQTVLQEMSQSASVEKILATLSKRKEWFFVGCGSSFYLAEAAANSWTLLTGQRARASEVLLFPQQIQMESAESQAVFAHNLSSLGNKVGFSSPIGAIPSARFVFRGLEQAEWICPGSVAWPARLQGSRLSCHGASSGTSSPSRHDV